jgi:hypothetical protein
MTTQGAQLRIHGKIPRVEAMTRSYAMLVRDGTIARLRVLPFFASHNFTFRRSRAFQLQPDEFPYCCVYLTGEDLTPDGDADAGEPRARSTVMLNHSIVIKNNDEDRAEDRLDDSYQAIMNGLLTDSTFYNNDQFKIQGFIRGKRSHSYGNAGRQDNETPYAEMKLELTYDLGTITWEPYVPDMLETIHVEAQHPPGDVNNTHVLAVYDLDQGEQ